MLSVKSCLTRTPPPWNPMTATRSAGVICVLMYLVAALYARSRSGGGSAVMSKYRTSSRRLRYRTSPGCPAEIFASVGEPAPAFAGGGDTGAVGASGRRVADRHLTARGRHGRETLELDERDRLRLAVFGDDEVLRRQAFDGVAVLVLDRASPHDQPRRAAERRRLWRRLLARGAAPAAARTAPPP